MAPSAIGQRALIAGLPIFVLTSGALDVATEAPPENEPDEPNNLSTTSGGVTDMNRRDAAPADRDSQGDLSAAIRREQLICLYDSLPVAAISNVVIGALLVSGVWNEISHTALLTWLSVVILVSMARSAMFLAYRKASPATNQLTPWIRRFFAGVVASGSLLGTATILIIPHGSDNAKPICTFAVICVMFGGAIVLSFMRWVFPVFLICATAPLLSSLLWSADSANPDLIRIVLAMTVMGIAYALRSSSYIYQNTLNNITLRLEAVHKEAALRKSEALLAEEKNLLRNVIDGIPDLISVKDGAGRYLGCNAAFKSLLGKTESEIVGKTDRQILSAAALAESMRQDEVVSQTKAPHVVEQWIDNPDGRRALIELHKLPLPLSQGGIGIVAIGHDITDRKAIERELIAARKAAEYSSMSKSTFLANMSHEIRTPMNAILGLTYLLQREINNQEQWTKLNKIHASAKHLLGILNDILDLSKIEADKLVLVEESINIALIVDQAMEIMADRAAAKELALGHEIDHELTKLMLIGDPLRIRQILLNFISNAIKFTEHGSVVVRARLTSRDDTLAEVRFEIQDTGIGISADALDRIFESFEQAESSTSRRFGGTGLGLAINRKLSRMMGGDSGAVSEPDQGSTFWFVVYLKIDHKAFVETEDAPNEQRLFGARVLLVEDDEINQEVARELLEDVGIDVSIANHGAEALAMLQSDSFDAILMDMQMPVMDGLEATMRIRRLDSLASQTPIIAMTANAFNEDKQRCEAAGMNDFIAKPVDPQDLFKVLDRWLNPDDAQTS